MNTLPYSGYPTVQLLLPNLCCHQAGKKLIRQDYTYLIKRHNISMFGKVCIKYDFELILDFNVVAFVYYRILELAFY